MSRVCLHKYFRFRYGVNGRKIWQYARFVWVAWDVNSTVINGAFNKFILFSFHVVNFGLFVSGTVLILFNLLLENSPEEVRTYCITTYHVLLAIIAFTAPQIGIWLPKHIQWKWQCIYRRDAFYSGSWLFILYIVRKERDVSLGQS